MTCDVGNASELFENPATHVAFKEWAAIVRALEQGKQDLVFRKGGIAEEGGDFALAHDRFFLFPTYFHQQEAGLGDAHTQLFEEAMRARPPQDRVVITSWVEVRRALAVSSEADLASYASRHVYAQHVLMERLHGRYGSTLFALEVAVHVLAKPLDLPLLPQYGGCRSWVDLDLPGR
jgi:hypothetical protein